MTTEGVIVDLAFNWRHFFWACGIGAISSLSLPLGTIIGLTFYPRKKITGALAAFGSGALIAALTLELVAPTVSALAEHDQSHGDPSHNFFYMIIGSLVGGFTFIILDMLLDSKGGFLRKTSTILSYFKKQTLQKNKKLLRTLGQVDILRKVNEEHIETLLELLQEKTFHPGEDIFHEGDQGDLVYFIESGSVHIIKDQKVITSSKSGTVLGEIALLTDQPRTAGAKAIDLVKVWALARKDFNDLAKKSPELELAVKKIALKRLKEYKKQAKEESEQIAKWSAEALENINVQSKLPNTKELQATKEKHSNANFAIWLGITLDSIPESFVIGTVFFSMLIAKGSHIHFSDLVPYTLIAGLFLSNFPESLSSSVGMKKQGSSSTKIFVMWFSLVILTALGAGLGYALSDQISHEWIIGVEGVAAGAMLTMIASTMIPEAVHLGGEKVVGIFTLFGFLSAISFKLLE